MTLVFIVALALFGGIDCLGDASSWQFIVLCVLAALDAAPTPR